MRVQLAARPFTWIRQVEQAPVVVTAANCSAISTCDQPVAAICPFVKKCPDNSTVEVTVRPPPPPPLLRPFSPLFVHADVLFESPSLTFSAAECHDGMEGMSHENIFCCAQKCSCSTGPQG